MTVDIKPGGIISIPEEILRQVGWKPGDWIEISLQRDKQEILIRRQDVKK